MSEKLCALRKIGGGMSERFILLASWVAGTMRGAIVYDLDGNMVKDGSIPASGSAYEDSNVIITPNVAQVTIKTKGVYRVIVMTNDTPVATEYTVTNSPVVVYQGSQTVKAITVVKIG